MKKRFLFPVVLIMILALMPSAAASSPFVYTDEDTGASFTVPSGWKMEDADDSWKHIDAVFTSSKYPGASIIYQNLDLWGTLSDVEKAGITRADYNNSVFSVEDIPVLFGVSPISATQVTYNGYTYFYFEVLVSPDKYNTPTAFTMAHLFRIENGWGYLFQVSGTPLSPYYGDFEELLNSMSYPEVKRSPFRNMPPVVTLLLGVLITAAACLLVPAIFCIKKKRLLTKEIKRIVWINGGCVWLLLQILTLALGGKPNSGIAVFLWSGVAHWLLRRNCALDDKQYMHNNFNRLVECKSCGYRSRDYFENCPQCGKGAKQYVYLNDSSAQPVPSEDNTAQ